MYRQIAVIAFVVLAIQAQKIDFGVTRSTKMTSPHKIFSSPNHPPKISDFERLSRIKFAEILKQKILEEMEERRKNIHKISHILEILSNEKNGRNSNLKKFCLKSKLKIFEKKNN